MILFVYFSVWTSSSYYSVIIANRFPNIMKQPNAVHKSDNVTRGVTITAAPHVYRRYDYRVRKASPMLKVLSFYAST